MLRQNTPHLSSRLLCHFLVIALILLCAKIQISWGVCNMMILVVLAMQHGLLSTESLALVDVVLSLNEANLSAHLAARTLVRYIGIKKLPLKQHSAQMLQHANIFLFRLPGYSA